MLWLALGLAGWLMERVLVLDNVEFGAHDHETRKESPSFVFLCVCVFVARVLRPVRPRAEVVSAICIVGLW